MLHLLLFSILSDTKTFYQLIEMFQQIKEINFSATFLYDDGFSLKFFWNNNYMLVLNVAKKVVGY